MAADHRTYMLRLGFQYLQTGEKAVSTNQKHFFNLYFDLFPFLMMFYFIFFFSSFVYHLFASINLQPDTSYVNPSEGLSHSNTPACVCACVRALTARLLADDPVRAVPAGARLPQAAVALDPEAGVGRQHGEGHVVRLPVGVGHLRVLAPHQTSTCGGNNQTATSTGSGGELFAVFCRARSSNSSSCSV